MVCGACGFEGYPGSGPCPLCGAGSSADRLAGESTVPIGEAPTVSPRPAPSVQGRARVPGETVAGRYVVEQVLGRGGMGTVYRVVDGTDGKRRALKVVHSALMEGPEGLDRFRREVELLSRVRHPSVPAVLGWGADGGEPYYVTELIDGADLKTEIRRLGVIPPRDAARLAAEIAEALHAAHEAGIVHRDVKPQNVMLDADGRVHLVDFGIARSVGRGTRILTGTGITLGTPEYMSPEQFETPRVDARSDIYSLGVLLFEMLTGGLPFTGDSPVAVAISHRTEIPRDVRALRPDVPAWLARIVATCLEKDRARRFGNAGELAMALRKSWPARAVRTRHLASGDVVREEDPEVEGFALVLESPSEKTGWESGMALVFEGRHYRLSDVLAPERSVDPWTYRFVSWPEEDVLRLVVDYETDRAERSRRTEGSLLGRLKRLLPGGPDRPLR
ncbi:MAG: serine/threonine protein kinase [Holophagales bacterium]|nr:serine/threonine protein kinase [Holophagales bacterium]